MKRLLLGLYVLGVLHWCAFVYGAYLPQGDRAAVKRLVTSPAAAVNPASWADFSAVDMHDWHKEIAYLDILRESVLTRTIPYHVPELDQLVSNVKHRFMGSPIFTVSPQIVLLTFIDSQTFAFINLLLMYSVGVYGLMRLGRLFGLGPVAFAFLFLLFNFNGYLVSKMSAYGPGQLGYFLLPFAFEFLLWASGPDFHTGPRSQWKTGIALGAMIGLIFIQGSLHIYDVCVLFVIAWAINNPDRWRVAVGAGLATAATGAVRLLPAAVSFWGQAKTRNYALLSTPEGLIEVTVLLRTHLSPPHFYWWAWSYYISIVGLLMLVYFGVWSIFLKYAWVRDRTWPRLLLPVFGLSFLAVHKFYFLLVPDWMPYFNSITNPPLLLLPPLMAFSIVAATNLEGFLEYYKSERPVQWLLRVAVIVLALFLFNHSRVWRLHRMQAEYDYVMAANVFPDEMPHPVITPHIENDPTDVGYIWAVQSGLAISGLSLIGVGAWLWRERRSAPRRAQDLAVA